MASECADHLACLQIPELESAIIRGRERSLAIPCDHCVPDAFAVAPEEPCCLSPVSMSQKLEGPNPFDARDHSCAVRCDCDGVDVVGVPLERAYLLARLDVPQLEGSIV